MTQLIASTKAVKLSLTFMFWSDAIYKLEVLIQKLYFCRKAPFILNIYQQAQEIRQLISLSIAQTFN